MKGPKFEDSYFKSVMFAFLKHYRRTITKWFFRDHKIKFIPMYPCPCGTVFINTVTVDMGSQNSLCYEKATISSSEKLLPGDT